MHGLINRSVQCFVRDTYGEDVWQHALERLKSDFNGFEAMLSYEDSVTYELLDGLSSVLNRPRQEVMEDIGTYLFVLR